MKYKVEELIVVVKNVYKSTRFEVHIVLCMLILYLAKKKKYDTKLL